MPEPEATYPALEGTKWTLEAFEPKNEDAIEIDTTENMPYFLYFDSDSTFISNWACNYGGGEYISETSGGILEVIGVGGTRSKCGWTIAFLQALQTSYEYQIEDSTLYILYSDVSYVYGGSLMYDRNKKGRLKFRAGINSVDSRYD